MFINHGTYSKTESPIVVLCDLYYSEWIPLLTMYPLAYLGDVRLINALYNPDGEIGPSDE